MLPDIAVIVPTLNEEKHIQMCLESVLQQTYPHEKMDILVVDGGSADRTQEIVLQMSQKWPNIRLINNPKKIQSVAFNVGVANSHAPIVIRLDAHACYENDYIEKCIQGLKSDSIRGNVGGKCIILPYNNSLWARANAILNYSRFGIGGSAFRVGSKTAYVDSVPFGAFPRSVVEKVGGMHEGLRRGEDNEYNSRLRKAGYKIFFDPSIISSYYARPTLKASCRQMFANGESIGHLFYVDKKSISLRHLIPLLFVLGIVCGFLISLMCPQFIYLLSIGLGLYSLCDVIASFLAARKHGIEYFFPLLVLFLCVHISYGCGTIVGFITGRGLQPYNN